MSSSFTDSIRARLASLPDRTFPCGRVGKTCTCPKCADAAAAEKAAAAAPSPASAGASGVAARSSAPPARVAATTTPPPSTPRAAVPSTSAPAAAQGGAARTSASATAAPASAQAAGEASAAAAGPQRLTEENLLKHLKDAESRGASAEVVIGLVGGVEMTQVDRAETESVVSLGASTVATNTGAGLTPDQRRAARIAARRRRAEERKALTPEARKLYNRQRADKKHAARLAHAQDLVGSAKGKYAKKLIESAIRKLERRIQRNKAAVAAGFVAARATIAAGKK
jgi:hypothetical protein